MSLLLTPQDLDRAHGAAVARGLALSRIQLLGSIDPGIAGAVPSAVNAIAQLQSDLQYLNTIWKGEGDPPLAIWLGNASALVTGQVEQSTFDALQAKAIARAAELRAPRDTNRGHRGSDSRFWSGTRIAVGALVVVIGGLGAAILFGGKNGGTGGAGGHPSTGTTRTSAGTTTSTSAGTTTSTSAGTSSSTSTSAGTSTSTSAGTSSGTSGRPVDDSAACATLNAVLRSRLGSVPSGSTGSAKFTMRSQRGSLTQVRAEGDRELVASGTGRMGSSPGNIGDCKSTTVHWP